MLSACPDNNKSNRIIVTTASNRVTNTICQGNGPVYKMRPLDKNSAKHLLGKKVMFPRNVDIDRLMTMILETCEYLPLAISNMGDYMRSLNKTWDYDECEKACTNIGSLLDNNEIEAFRGMKHVVNRSYTRLSVNAKACLLSVNIYFKNLVIENHVINDHVIKGKPLIRRLLAERLISSSPSSSVDVLANECFTELIEQNFIVPVEVSISGQVKRFRVNRMIRCLFMTKGTKRIMSLGLIFDRARTWNHCHKLISLDCISRIAVVNLLGLEGRLVQLMSGCSHIMGRQAKF